VSRYALWLPSPLLGLGEIVARVANLFTIVVIVRSAGVRGYGRIGISLALLDLLLLLADMGFGTVGTRELAQDGGQGRDLRRVVTRARLTTAPLAMLVGLAAAALLPGLDPQTRRVTAITSVAVLSVIVLSDWALIAMGRNGAAGAARAATSLVYLALVYAASRLLTGGTLDAFAGARVVSLVLGAILTWVVATRYLARDKKAVMPVRGLVVFAVHLGAAALFIRVYNVADTLVLGVFRSSQVVGAYRAAYTIVLLPLGIAYLLNVVLAPRLAALAAADVRAFLVSTQRFIVVGTSAMTGIAAAIAVAAEPLSHLLYGHHTGSIAYLTRLLAPTIPLDYLASAYMLGLVAGGRPAVLAKAAGAAAVTNIGLSFALTPGLGQNGAVAASLLAYGVLTTIFWWSWRSFRRQTESAS